ncbi:MAG: WecB/TagA/CpsF family glycosyltransferase, partial [Desulfomonilia bacterium]
LLGSPLKERIRTAELVAGILAEAASRGVSACFLGPRELRVAPPAAADGENGPAQPVKGRSPGWFRLSGGRFGNTEARDLELVDRVNETGSGILVVSLRSSRLASWLGRNRNRLRVPVVIGVDGSLEHPACRALGAVTRTLRVMGRPAAWLMRGGPAGLLKIWLLIWPSAFSHLYARLTSPHSYLKMFKHPVVLKRGTRGSCEYSLITLPGIVDRETVRRISTLVPRRPRTHLVLDLKDVGFVDSAGFGLLLRVIRLWEGSGLRILFAGLDNDMRKRLKRNRLYSLVSHREYPTADDALNALDDRDETNGGMS